jgi:hypothetical protein
MLRARFLVGWALVAVTGCSSQGSPSGSSDGGGASQSAASSTAASSSSGAGGADALSLFASLREETAVGEAPALVRFANDSDLHLTLWIGDQEYFKVAPHTATEGRAVASSDVLGDALVGYHNIDDTCIKVPFDALGGVTALEPGRAYSVHVEVNESYQAYVTEDAMPAPFTAIRPLLQDPFTAAEPGAMSKLTVTLAGEPAYTFEGIASEFARAYWLMPDPAEITSLEFVDRSGGEHSAAPRLSVSGAYTLLIDDAPADDAAHVVDFAPP